MKGILVGKTVWSVRKVVECGSKCGEFYVNDNVGGFCFWRSDSDDCDFEKEIGVGKDLWKEVLWYFNRLKSGLWCNF